MIEIRPTNPIDVGVRALISELDDYHRAIYPEPSNHLDPAKQLVKPNVCFVGAYDEHGHENNLLGIGAIKYLCHDCDYGEIKRVYVRAAERGQGISKLIMAYLENDARKKGVKIVRLETGIHQLEAIGLYEKSNYRHRACFGDYTEDPLSVFMEKILTKTLLGENPARPGFNRNQASLL
ncbi:GNAT family N-acetyltransferase [Candidatus Spongiihabitans sp.]|uniref:GNAT family N-acetyltransferase n=1 Tax=Candidatus Spongiihabitans sp. TaxID=3101308 RepID=UPI003C7DC040